MKKKWKIFLALILLILMISPINGQSDQNNASPVKSAASNEIVERQEKNLQIDQLTQSGNTAYINKDYPKAKDYYLKAIMLLSKNPAPGDDSERRIAKIREALSSVYTAWAEDLMFKAYQSADKGDIDKASSLSKEAVEINPAIRAKADILQNKMAQLRLYAKYKDLSSEKKIIPEKEDKSMKIELLYEQAKNLYVQKAYTKSKEKFEEILQIDPYNLSAINYIKKINIALYQLGEARTDVTQIQRQSEIKWEEITTSIPAVSDGSRIDYAGNKPISKSDDLSAIKKKLNGIIIKNISFEDVPIDTAILYLKQESKKLDPEGKGINFFMRLDKEIPENNAELQNKTAQKETDSWETEQPKGNKQAQQAPASNQYLITIVLDNVPLGTAIDYICRAAGLKYRINKYAIEIASPNISFEDLETQVFPIERECFDDFIQADQTADLKMFFADRGVAFADGTTAVFDPKISRLIVRNTQKELNKIKEILSKMELTLPQVSIATKFVEMSQTDFDELGFEWQTTYQTSAQGSWQNGYDPKNPINRNESTPGVTENEFAQNDKAFGMLYQNGGLGVQGTIHALDMSQNAEVLSSPEVTTLSGHKAVIKMEIDNSFPTSWSTPTITWITNTNTASNVPAFYQVPSAPTVTSTDITPTGVVFAVTPYVSSDNYTIDLILEPMIQSFQGWTSYSYSTISNSNNKTVDLFGNVSMPIINQRTVQTQVRSFDGDTVVLGGALTDITKNIDDRTPILGDMPLIGRFFRSQVQNQEKINLVIFTTVRLVKPDGSPLRPQQNNGLPDTRKL